MTAEPLSNNRGLELSLLAPEIPEGLEKLGDFNTYSIETSPDGTSANVRRLRKIGEQESGYRVVDEQTFSLEAIEKSEAWIAGVYNKIRMNNLTPLQIHRLGMADEIVKIVAEDLRRLRDKELSPEPTL